MIYILSVSFFLPSSHVCVAGYSTLVTVRVLSFHHMNSGAQTQAIRLGSRHLHSLNHLTLSTTYVFNVLPRILLNKFLNLKNPFLLNKILKNI